MLSKWNNTVILSVHDEKNGDLFLICVWKKAKTSEIWEPFICDKEQGSAWFKIWLVTGFEIFEFLSLTRSSTKGEPKYWEETKNKNYFSF